MDRVDFKRTVILALSLIVIKSWGGVQSLSAVGVHTCAVNEKQEAFCWGGNGDGQLGLGKVTSVATPVKVAAGVESISINRFHTCAILVDGGVKCWGRNTRGQLGLGLAKDSVGGIASETVDKLPKVDLGRTERVKQIAVGTGHTCALFSDGIVKCWGTNDKGELGLGITVKSVGRATSEMGSALPFVQLGTNRKATQVAVGDGYTCALLDDGTVKCWGKWEAIGSEGKANLGQSSSQMGDGLKAVPLGDLKTVRIATSKSSACALLESGQVKCWGVNAEGILGAGLKDGEIIGDEAGEIAKLVGLDLGGLSSLDVSCGYMHCCSILENHALKCWGDNTTGQLGVEDTLSRGKSLDEMGTALPFVDLGPMSSVKSVSLGSVHSCAVLEDSTIRCWGRNSYGQLGRTTPGNSGDFPGTMGTALTPVELR